MSVVSTTASESPATPCSQAVPNSTAGGYIATTDPAASPAYHLPQSENEGPLDELAFQHFAPLLAACQDYASFSGCRCRRNSFRGIPGAEAAVRGGNTADSRAGSSGLQQVPQSDGGRGAVGAARDGDHGPRLAAKLLAAGAVGDFAIRLRGNEASLTEELNRSFRIVMVESVRNAMLSMFQAMEMFPPDPAPDVADDDCAYEDVSAPLPQIAQRLYNDQVRRISDTTGGPARLEKRAMTACFIVDFADACGVALPPIPQTQQDMLKEFIEKASEAAEGKGEDQQRTARQVFLNGLGAGAAAEVLRDDAQKWWSENWKSVAMGVAGAALLGLGAALAVGAAAALQRGGNQRRDREESE